MPHISCRRSELEDEARRRRGKVKIAVGLAIIGIVLVATYFVGPVYYG